MAHSTDIVGYVYRAETYCPEHVVDDMTSIEAYDGWKLAESVNMSTESNLTEIAAHFQINRQDESSFDSDEFPKVIFRDQADESFCGVCGIALA